MNRPDLYRPTQIKREIEWLEEQKEKTQGRPTLGVAVQNSKMADTTAETAVKNTDIDRQIADLSEELEAVNSEITQYAKSLQSPLSEIVMLRCVFGFTYEKIAGAIGIPRQTVEYKFKSL